MVFSTHCEWLLIFILTFVYYQHSSPEEYMLHSYGAPYLQITTMLTHTSTKEIHTTTTLISGPEVQINRKLTHTMIIKSHTAMTFGYELQTVTENNFQLWNANHFRTNFLLLSYYYFCKDIYVSLIIIAEDTYLFWCGRS